TQSGARLEVWLDKPCKQVTVRITGTMSLSHKPTPNKAGRFVVSGPRLPWTTEKPGRIQIVPSAGIALEAERLLHLVRAQEASPPETWLLVPSLPIFEGSFHVRRATQAIEARSLTRLERRAGSLNLAARVDCWLPEGQAPTFTIQVHDWPDQVALDLSVQAQHVQHRKQGTTQSWRLTFPPGPTRRVVAKLSGSISDSDSAVRIVPKLTVAEAN